MTQRVRAKTSNDDKATSLASQRPSLVKLKMRTQTILTIAGATALTGLVGYAIYFDHRRQTDPKFRKKLQREKKKLAKSAKANEASATGALKQRIEEAVKQVARPGVLPDGVEQREAFFMQSVSEGETLFAQGPAHHFDASIAFYKALKVYPNPMELVMIYQKAVPQEVFGIIMEMVAADGKLNGGESADPLSSLAGAAAGAPTRTAASLDEVDDDSPSGGAAAGPSAGASPVSQPVSSSASGEHDASSQEGNRGPPSTYSSQEGNGIASGYSSNPEGSATGGNASAYSSQEWEKVSTSSGSATVGGPSSSNEGINLPDVASAPVELDAAPAPAAAATGTAAGHADEDVKAPAPPATSTADIFNAAPAPEATTEQAAISAQQDIFAAVQDAAQDADAASSQAPQ